MFANDQKMRVITVQRELVALSRGNFYFLEETDLTSERTDVNFYHVGFVFCRFQIDEIFDFVVTDDPNENQSFALLRRSVHLFRPRLIGSSHQLGESNRSPFFSLQVESFYVPLRLERPRRSIVERRRRDHW